MAQTRVDPFLQWELRPRAKAKVNTTGTNRCARGSSLLSFRSCSASESGAETDVWPAPTKSSIKQELVAACNRQSSAQRLLDAARISARGLPASSEQTKSGVGAHGQIRHTAAWPLAGVDCRCKRLF